MYFFHMNVNLLVLELNNVNSYLNYLNGSENENKTCHHRMAPVG